MDFLTEEEILLLALDKANEHNLILKDEDLVSKIQQGYATENQYVLDFSTHSYVWAWLDDKIKEIFLNSNLDTASGYGLDNLGKLHNINRVQASKSQLEVQVNLNVTSEDNLEIPAGTRVLFDTNIASNLKCEYYTKDSLLIPSGVSTATVICESDNFGSMSKVPSYSARGLEGFETQLYCINALDSNGGHDIEDDEHYRTRIRNWITKNLQGSRDCFIDFLDNLDGITDYRLLPKWNGIGTLKVIVDCLPSELDNIQSLIQQYCMLYNDDPVVVVNPDTETIKDIHLYVHLDENSSLGMTSSEITDMIIGQARVFLDGGTGRLGTVSKGLSIGNEYDPSKLISFLHSEIPEIANVHTDISVPVHIPDTSILVVENISVEYE